ncbi:L-fucose isomerase, C-terminal domain protein [Bacteroidetes bacterium oral taxon 272 str. F0290]|nr:L-fucose isomerase, C-terminal domain protein [Bacteroidetes bacterium oral taxon 272 str. F0290]
MNLYLIIFQHIPFKREKVYEEHQELFEEIEKYFKLYLVPLNKIDKIPVEEYKMAFIATSRVENIITQYFDDLPYPIHLLCDGQQGSLTAALEVSTWIRNKGMKVHLIHGTTQTMVKQLLDHHWVFAARREIKTKRIGVIGFPSPWIIASNVDYLMTKRRLGIELVNIDPKQVLNLYDKVTDDEIGPMATQFVNDAAEYHEGDPDALLKGMRLYKALKLLAEHNQLHALTFASSPMLDKINITGNVAASLLNNEGIITACEGDLQSVVTMMVAKILTGQSSFMGNVSFLNEEENTFVISHSSIPTSMTERYHIRNEASTEKGIAIQGVLNKQEVTVLKCGGECLDEYFVSRGKIIDNTELPFIGRTQLCVQMQKSIGYFYSCNLGNHHILLTGDHVQVIKEFMQLYESKSVY